jgi:hypothetical protein
MVENMNYKIRITEDNQAIVERIADENGMNPNDLEFSYINFFYVIDPTNKFIECGSTGKGEELTTQQFITIYDKKENLIGRWFEALEDNGGASPIIKGRFYLIEKQNDDCIYFKVPTYYDPKWLFMLNKFNQENCCKLMPKDFQPTEESPKVETEWQPKRGDKVLVWDDNNYCERIFLAEIKKSKYPIVTVNYHYEKDFLNDDVFCVVCYKHMKPLPIEQPKETDFKSKVIELIEGEINDLKVYEKRQIEINEYYNNHSSVASRIKFYNDLLNKIKQL